MSSDADWIGHVRRFTAVGDEQTLQKARESGNSDTVRDVMNLPDIADVS